MASRLARASARPFHVGKVTDQHLFYLYTHMPTSIDEYVPADFVRAFYTRDDLVLLLLILRQRTRCSGLSGICADIMGRTMHYSMRSGPTAMIFGLIRSIETRLGRQRHGLLVEMGTMGVRERRFWRGNKHGHSKWWNPNGTLRIESTYLHGIAHGWYRVYSSDGTLERSERWVHGYV